MALLADCLPQYNILVPDLPGFGDSPAFTTAEHSLPHYLTFLTRLRHQWAHHPHLAPFSTPKTILLGHSFGSVLASFWATQTNDWKALLLINPISQPALTPNSSPLQRGTSLAAQGYYQLAAKLPNTLGRALLNSPLSVWITTTIMTKTHDLKTLSYTHDQHRNYFSAFDTRTMLLQAYQASTNNSVLDVAEHLKLPVLSVTGAQDELGTPRSQHHLAQVMSNSAPMVVHREFPDVGHLIHYEKPAETAALVEKFVAGLPAH